MSKRDGTKNVYSDIEHMASLKHWGEPPDSMADDLDKQAVIDCGWGRLIFAQTFRSTAELADQLRNETEGRRDVALYSREPHVLVAQAPQRVFIDPSLTFRLNLQDTALPRENSSSIEIRRMRNAADAYHVNRIYKSRSMVPMRDGFEDHLRKQPELQILVAVDREQGQVVGCVTGVDHQLAFGDPDNGASLWALAVDPQCSHPGIGAALTIELAQRFQTAGRAFMDLSVIHDNAQAIKLYEKLGFFQVPVYCIKTKNAINEQLYVGSGRKDELNIYAQIIVDEAYRRGILVEVVDPAGGFFDLSLGGRTIRCRESLTDLTSAVALSRCDDKAVTHRFLDRAGLDVPEQKSLITVDDALNFLHRHERIVIKPARGEQGASVFVDLREEPEVQAAFAAAFEQDENVIGERFVIGEDLRIIVINHEVVAAAVRKPATVTGDGKHTVAELIRKQSRRRSAATQGESSIPMDEETRRCVADAGLEMADKLPYGELLKVRKTANLHTGSTMHDVTSKLHPALVDAATRAARALHIPVVGLDFIVPDVAGAEYSIIEANERPGLANHEPQPTAAKLLDMLFPQTAVQHR